MSDTDSTSSSKTLAARCTACGTVFRVVPDQLRVSGGWVRCGRCAAVFNAAENLIDLESGAPRRLDLGIEISSQPPMAAAPRVEAKAAPRAKSATAVAPSPPAPVEVLPSAPSPEPPLEPPPERPSESPSSPATAKASGPEADSDSVSAPLHDPDPGPESKSAPPRVADSDSKPTLNEPATPAEIADNRPPQVELQPEAKLTKLAPAPKAPPLPSFVRRADRAARWNQPRVRAALAAGVVVGVLLLAAQVGLAYRDLAAARWPALRPLLTALCQPLACTVSPPKSINDLTVEGSALVRVDLSDLYQLNVALRNRAELDLAMPALELSLTDRQGRLLSRRVLQASDFGITQPTLAAGRDLEMQTTLRTAPQSTDGANGEASAERAAIVGYTIELFYP